MIRAAVEVGTDATRLVVPGPDGRAEPVAVLPAGTTAATALDELVGCAAAVVLVHPPGWAPERAAAELPGRRVHTVPGPVAVLAGETGRRLVVDAGRSGTTLTVVDGGCVRSTERVPIGGDRLDAVLAAATGCPPDRVRAAREALSFRDGVDIPGFGRIDAGRAEEVLRPEFDDVVARVPALVADVVEIVVAGGLARTPLLAAMLDERAGCPVRVLPEPDLAAVRGALPWSGEPREVDDVVDVTGSPTAAERTGPEGTAASGSSATGGGRPDDATRPRRSRVLPAVAVLGALLAGTGAVLGATPRAPAPPAGTLVQYGYAAALPAGWEHTGGDPERRRTLLTRTGSPDGVELVSVERSPLGYDGTTEPGRAHAELDDAYRRAAGAEALRDLRPDTVAGRAVTRYRQQAGPDAVVDWYVLFDGTDELVVGCRRPARGPAPELDRACADVVGSVRAGN